METKDSRQLIRQNGFLESVVGVDASSKEEAIIDILIARGFLIDRFEDGWYLSDNADYKDAEDLAAGLAEHNIGRVVYDSKYYEEKTREPWVKDPVAKPISYKSLLPHKVRIDINNNASIEDAWAFFQSIPFVSFAVCGVKNDWCEFSRIMFPFKVAAMYFEPYVALYVKAASSCGVYMYYSCDGNHEKGGSVIARSEYPSTIWHKWIWESVVQPRFGQIPFIDGNGIRYNAQTQAQVFQDVYKIALFLYSNRFEIRRIKYEAASQFTKKFLRTHTDEEIEAVFIDNCNMLRPEWDQSF